MPMHPDSKPSPQSKEEIDSHGAPEAQADFGLWSKMPYWTVDEASALLLGENPDVLNDSSLNESNQDRDLLRIYRGVRVLTSRAVEMGYLDKRIDPHKFIKWARDRTQLRVSKELITAVEKLENNTKTDEITESVEQTLTDSERTSLLKLALGMAIKRYGYDPGKQKNDATGNNRDSIVSDLAQLGLDLNSDTVRKYLKEAEQRFGDPLKNPRKD
jgi:hypothetical protein